MSIRSEWTLSLPFEGGWISLSANIPDMLTMSDEDAKFVNKMREQMLDHIHQVILAKQAAKQEAADAADTATIPKRQETP